MVKCYDSLGALTPLFDWGEVLVITFGKVDHHVLAALWQLSHALARRAGVPGKQNIILK